MSGIRKHRSLPASLAPGTALAVTLLVAVAIVAAPQVASADSGPAELAPATTGAAKAATGAAKAAAKKRHTKKKPCRARRRGKVYRTPGYRGVCKSPKTKPAPPLPSVAIGRGRSPNVLVDAAGTAHVVWVESPFPHTSPDVVHYCRLKRGSEDCDNPPATRSFIPSQPGGPAYNVDAAGPRVVAIGDDLAIISHRYPNVTPKPDGTNSDRSTYMWVSDDGGDSFVGPGLVGDAEPTGGAVAFGPPSAPRIGLISDTRTGGTFFQAIAPGVYTAAEANLGANGPDRAYSGTLADVGGVPLAAFSDLTGHTYIRAWNGTGDPNDAGTWSEAATSGVEPHLAAGPSGVYMVTRPDFLGPLQVRKLNGLSPGAPVTVTTDRDRVVARDLFEDTGGRLHLAWNNGKQLLERSSLDGDRFAPERILAQGASLDGIDLGSAGDGGGFAVTTRAPGSIGTGSTGDILAAPFGTQVSNGLRGLGGLPGAGAAPGTVVTCQEIGYGAVQILAQEGCLLGAPGKPGVKISEGVVRINGLEIVPDAGVKILLGTRAHTIDTTGTVTVQLRAAGKAIVLFRGELHIRLPSGGAGVRLASFDTSKFPVKIAGFSVAGDIDPILRERAVEIPISLKLPKALGGVSGAATLRADNARGLHLDSVRFHVGTIPLGPLVLENLEASWTGSSSEWTGGGAVRLAGARLELRVRFARGAFKEGFVKVTPVPFPGVTLFTDVFLNSVSGRLALDPTFIEAGAFVGAQPIAPPDTYVLGIDAKLRVTITPRFAIDATGNGKLAVFPVFTAALHGDADGYFSARARADLNLAEIVDAGGSFEGFFDTGRGLFGATGDFHGCLGDPPLGVCSGFKATVSSRGVAGCAGGFIGFGYRWRGGGELLGPPSCDISDYEIKARAAGAHAAAAAQSFTLPAGMRSASIRLTGASAAPDVVLVSPSGARVQPTPVSAAGAAKAAATVAATGAATVIGLRRPARGTWRVEPQAGSSVREIAVARGLAPPKVSARVRGKARRRVLVYRASDRPGLVVRFFERVGAGARQIGVARGRRGRIRFAPADGRRGKRAIVAIAEQNGLPRLQRKVASYRAPGPIRPAKVRGLRVRRAHGRLTIRWRRAGRAASYVVRIRLSDGRRVARVVDGRRLRLRGVARGDAVRVSVAGRSAHGRQGHAARAKLRARRR